MPTHHFKSAAGFFAIISILLVADHVQASEFRINDGYRFHKFSPSDIRQIRVQLHRNIGEDFTSVVMLIYAKQDDPLHPGFAFRMRNHTPDAMVPNLYYLSQIAEMIKKGKITAFVIEEGGWTSVFGTMYPTWKDSQVFRDFFRIVGFYFSPIVAGDLMGAGTEIRPPGLSGSPPQTPDKPKMSSLPTRISMEPDTDRPGMDYKNFWMDQPCPECCRDACADDPNCKAYTYVKPRRPGEKARCFLKKAVPPAKKNNCCISGAKSKR